MRYFWLLLAVVVTAVIFVNSSLPATESGRLSGVVAQLVLQLARLTDITLTGNVEHTIRKLAHFCEYALLGFLLFFTYLSYTRKKLWFFIPSLVGIVIPFCDEGLQFFSDGRAPSFKDVGIDISGAAFGFLCAWAVYFVVLSIVRAKRKKSCKG